MKELSRGLAVADEGPVARLDDLPTPALLLDVEVLARNLHAMQSRADTLGVRLRPHVKTHKCVEIGITQRLAGAHGITVSTLAEARVFAEAGFDDILWAFPLNLSRVDEAVELSQRVNLGLTVDSVAAVEALEGAAANLPLSVWMEIDCGYGRSGVPHDSPLVAELASRIAGSKRLALRGCLTHAGHTYAAGSPSRIAAVAEEERRAIVAAGEAIRAAGIDPGTLSVGSTPGMSHVRHLRGVDEIRPGNYALFDYSQVRLGSCEVADCAVTVLATIVSEGSVASAGFGTSAGSGVSASSATSASPIRPAGRGSSAGASGGEDAHGGVIADCGETTEGQAAPGTDDAHGGPIADCGALALSKDVGPDNPPHYGCLFDGIEAGALGPDRVISVSQEHGRVSGARRVGEKIRILPNHACLTVAHFDHFEVVWQGRVVDRWKIHRTRE